MNAVEEFRRRHQQYQVHKALLSGDELAYYAREIERDALSAEERAFLDASTAACDRSRAREPAEEVDAVDAGLDEARQALERQRDDLQIEYDRAVDRLRVQEQMNLLGERMRGQHELLARQNWMGSSVVIGTGVLFWITGDDIIAGAFVTLSSMFLQTMAGNFAGFFGGGHLGQQQMARVPEHSEPAPKPAARKS